MLEKKKTNAERCQEYYYAHRDEQLIKRKEHYEENKDIVNSRNMEYYEEHKEELNRKRREYGNARYPTIKEKHLAYFKEHNQIPEVKAKIKERNHKRYEENRDKLLKQTKEYNSKHKLETAVRNAASSLIRKTEVLTHYGNGKCVCVMCGYDNIGALSIDHINGNGCEHRREIGKGGGINFYKWLKDNNLPEGFQTLCMNCQFLKRIANKEQTLRLKESNHT